MSTYYQINKERLLEQAKQYYENTKKRLLEKQEIDIENHLTKKP